MNSTSSVMSLLLHVALAAGSQVDRETAGATVHSPMILIVEADATVRRLLEHALGCNGFSVRFANDADEARRVFERHQAELALMITDLMSGGYEFVKSIPTLEPRVPVLFTTTHVEQDLEAVMRSGFPVLAKPFMPSVLVSMVQRLFPRARLPGWK